MTYVYHIYAVVYGDGGAYVAKRADGVVRRDAPIISPDDLESLRDELAEKLSSPRKYVSIHSLSLLTTIQD